MVRASVVVVVGVLLAAGCRNNPPPTVPLAPVGVASAVAEVGCGELLTGADVVDDNARFEAIGGVIDAVREGQCSPADDEARLCRSLFLIAASDPLAGRGAGLDSSQLDQMLGWHQWALADGAAAADALGEPSLGEALRSLDAISDEMTSASRSSDLAAMAIARADSAIIEPLAAAEQVCLSLPR